MIGCTNSTGIIAIRGPIIPQIQIVVVKPRFSVFTISLFYSDMSTEKKVAVKTETTEAANAFV